MTKRSGNKQASRERFARMRAEQARRRRRRIRLASGVTVLTDAKEFTLYSFAPDTRPDRTATGQALATGRLSPGPRPPARA